MIGSQSMKKKQRVAVGKSYSRPLGNRSTNAMKISANELSIGCVQRSSFNGLPTFNSTHVTACQVFALKATSTTSSRSAYFWNQNSHQAVPRRRYDRQPVSHASQDRVIKGILLANGVLGRAVNQRFFTSCFSARRPFDFRSLAATSPNPAGRSSMWGGVTHAGTSERK